MRELTTAGEYWVSPKVICKSLAVRAVSPPSPTMLGVLELTVNGSGSQAPLAVHWAVRPLMTSTGFVVPQFKVPSSNPIETGKVSRAWRVDLELVVGKARAEVPKRTKRMEAEKVMVVVVVVMMMMKVYWKLKCKSVNVVVSV